MKVVFDGIQISKTIRRITHEIIEKNNDLKDIIIVGIETKGVPLANIIRDNIKEFTNIDVVTFPINITNFRDDTNKKEKVMTKINYGFKDKTVIIVDDVLYTGRTVRAALDFIISYGRPKKIELAVLIDRGHRELPIRADYVGKNLPTNINEKVVFDPKELNIYIK